MGLTTAAMQAMALRDIASQMAIYNDTAREALGVAREIAETSKRTLERLDEELG